MSPNQTKNLIQECADCGSSNTKWASINHGVLICDECCLVHRSLGRCISIIKSISKSYWPQSLIDTVYELVRNNSNQIWEANLNSAETQQLKQVPRKKPTPKDPINTTKTNYIKAKYENLYFITRGKYSSIEELNQQLYNAVKTNNYELCLRILSQGADANYRNPDDSLTCLHNAVLHSQLGQIELLAIYGADLMTVDRHGNTPFDLAKLNNLNNIADRLIELQFELTDDLTYYVCNKRPDHKSGQHFLIPDLSEHGDQNEFLKITKNRLQELPDHLFEELCKDIYDEADRRQLETIWKCSVGQHLVNEPIPFLVIKSCFSQTRNQLRQKLARFNSIEFSNLIVEILLEAKRRYNTFFANQKAQKTLSRKLKQFHDDSIDDDPLYDKVPSDEDYASVASEPTTSQNNNEIIVTKNQTSTLTPIVPQTQTTTITNNYIVNQLNVMTSNSNPVSQINSPNNTLFEYLSPNRALQKTQLNAKVIAKEHKIVELKTNFEKINSLNTTPITSYANNFFNSQTNSASKISSNQELTLYSSQNDLKISKSKLNDIDRKTINELQNENELMKSMINSLMEENAQLRADKMLLSMNHNGLNNEDSYGLYSTVNKKSSSLKTIRAAHNSPLKSFNINFSKNTNDDALKNEIEKIHTNVSNVKRTRNDTNESDYENQTLNNQIVNYSLMSPISRENSNEDKNTSSSPSVKIINKRYSNEHLNSNFNNNSSQNSSNNNVNLINRLMKKESTPSPISSLPNSPAHFFSPSFTKNDSKTTATKLVLADATSIMPTKDTVIRKMKKITKIIQELYKAIKESKFDMYKYYCEKVHQSVIEMIQLFPQTLNSEELQECLATLSETGRKLYELINKYNNQLCNASNEQQDKITNKTTIVGHLSNSSSTSSAMSSISGGNDAATNSDLYIRNQIASNIISYCYDIAFTVKKLVCIIGADN